MTNATATFTADAVDASEAQHLMDWALNDARSYGTLQKLAVPGNFSNSYARYCEASNLVVKVYEKMKRAGDMSAGMSGYSETAMALALKLFLDYRPEA